MDIAEDENLVYHSDRLAFALLCIQRDHHCLLPSERRAAIKDRARSIVQSMKGWWHYIGYEPGEGWTIADY